MNCKMMRKLLTVCAMFAALPLTAVTTPAVAAAPGVSADEIVIGHVSDLSGPIALLGTPLRDGLLMRFDEANANGGVYGRKLRLVVEDAAYDPRRGVLATRKLIERDRAFAFIATTGTPVVMATMPLVLEAGRLHLFPFSPHEATYTPLHPLKFQNFAPYQDYMAAAARHMISRGNYQRSCLLYQDDEYGQEVMRGVEQGLETVGRELVARTSYKRGALDLSSQVARLRAANCDLVVLATVVRETVAAVTEARRQGWQVDMLVTASGYSAQTHELGGEALEGLYGVSVLPHPYREGASLALAEWIAAYQARYSAAPNVWSVMGYTLADLFVRAAMAAGPEPDAESFARALENLSPQADIFGSPPYRFSAEDHLGNRRGRLAQIRDGRWQLLSDYLD